jgi:hypothetical protein
MDTRTRKIIILSTVVFIALCVTLIVVALVVNKGPGTQKSKETVVIDNYSKYTDHISSDSFGNLGNYLYRFIKDPSESVYHATIADGSYTYSSTSWFSEFIVKLNNSDVSWKIKLQTIDNGVINGDISVTCNTGECLSFSDQINTKPILQAYLPLNTSDYIIAAKTNDLKGISVVYYDQQGAGKEKALEKIRSLGFNPDDYTIEYHYGGR